MRPWLRHLPISAPCGASAIDLITGQGPLPPLGMKPFHENKSPASSFPQQKPHQEEIQAMPSFSFFIVSTNIKNTRSKHKDTDWLVMNVKVGLLASQLAFKSLGDLDSGNCVIDLALLGIDLEPGISFVFNYMIVNAGSASEGDVSGAIQNASILWSNGQGGPASANLTGALEDGQNWFNNELKSILNPNSCDGMVAAEQNHLTYETLTSMLSNNIFRHTTNHPGVHSPSGCGPNSQYTVTWEIDKTEPPQ
jgi:hypothetical protein